jgi:hypothetical protein
MITNMPKHDTNEEVSFDGRTVAVGNTYLVKLTGQATQAVVKVTRIDLNDDGSARDVTVAVWAKKSGAKHPQQGLTRTLLPAALDTPWQGHLRF